MNLMCLGYGHNIGSYAEVKKDLWPGKYGGRRIPREFHHLSGEIIEPNRPLPKQKSHNVILGYVTQEGYERDMSQETL